MEEAARSVTETRFTWRSDEPPETFPVPSGVRVGDLLIAGDRGKRWGIDEAWRPLDDVLDDFARR